MAEKFARWWCMTFHGRITRPVNGHYFCLRCAREYRVDWNTPRVDFKMEPER